MVSVFWFEQKFSRFQTVRINQILLYTDIGFPKKYRTSIVCFKGKCPTIRRQGNNWYRERDLNPYFYGYKPYALTITPSLYWSFPLELNEDFLYFTQTHYCYVKEGYGTHWQNWTATICM